MQLSVEAPPRPAAFQRVRRSWIAAGGALIVLAVLSAYGNSLFGPFVFDDQASITENSSLRQLGAIRTVLSPPYAAGETVGGRPILNLSFALNYACGGVSPFGYHLVNLAIHALAALVLFGILRRTLELPAVQSRIATWAPEPALLAGTAALLWAIHPLQTESVTYVAQRAESLMGLFYLLTLYGFIRFAGGSSVWAWLSVLAGFLGMATKEVMVSAPVMVFLYDRTFISGGVRAAWHRHWRLHLGLASSWILLAWLIHSTRGRGGTIGDVAWWRYALTQGGAIVHYLRLTVWPAPLVFDYGAEWVRSPWTAVPPIALVLALLAGTIAAWRRWPWLAFLGTWFFAILAPTSLVPGGRQTMAEHRMYLALAPLAVLAVGGIAWGCFRGDRRPRRAATAGCVALVAAVAAILIVLTAARNAVYAREISLWQSTVRQRPENPYARNNLGAALRRSDRPAAIREFEAAIRLKPAYAEAHCNLGAVLAQRGDFAEALGQLQTAIRLRPNYAEAFNNLGLVLNELGRSPEAISAFQRAVEIAPHAAEIHFNLGQALLQTQRFSEAWTQLTFVVRLRPGWAEGHFELGNALALLDRDREAIAQYEEALRIAPDHLRARENLRWLRSAEAVSSPR